LSLETEELLPGQRRDRISGLVQPWFVPTALDEIETWDMSSDVVLEWGAGRSTLWWASRAGRVISIESSAAWIGWIRSNLSTDNVELIQCDWGEVEKLPIPESCVPTIVVVDGSARTACLEAAIHLPRPLKIVCDNWQQPDVYVDDVAVQLMAPFVGKIYAQQQWQTAIWWL